MTFLPAVRIIQAAALMMLTSSLSMAQEAAPPRETRQISGWTVHVRRDLIASSPREVERAMELLKAMLDAIVLVVPKPAVVELQKVPLWFSSEYPATPPRAEYHPGADWLRNHQRDPVMVQGVEFTNTRIFEAEVRRMPNFALHELAHAFHHRVLVNGYDNADIKAAFELAKSSGKYERVERRDSEGRRRIAKAYAITNPQEYFAECTEAFFGKNDFFPFTHEELKKNDPAMCELLGRLWGAPGKP